MRHPFLFLNHGEGPGTIDLWLALADPKADAAPLAQALEAWASDAADVFVEREGATVSVSCRFPKSSAVLKSLEQVLTTAHAATPLSLVVRTNRVKPSAWHADTLAQPEAVLDALERHVLSRPKSEYAALPIQLDGGQTSLQTTAWEALELHSVRAAWVQAALRVVQAGVKKDRAAAAVWHDLVVGRLPAWLGHDFGCDLAIQEQLSKSLAIAAGSVEMPKHFTAAFGEMVRRSHASAQWHQGEEPAAKPGAFDWGDVRAVRAALKSRSTKWGQLQGSFRDSNRKHIATLVALTPAERLALVKKGWFSTLMLNAATLLLTSGEFADALGLFEAGIEARFPAAAAANPLYAVQDDNNHLGIDKKRHQRFLKKCLPHGEANPTVFLNASGVSMELGDHDGALEQLRLAKKHGLDIKPYKNDRLYIPLRALPAFKALMR
ncbi:MAG: hypothetical protein U0228_34870 [Myxococcaceae bacterium]